eukprot:CAMPEP_0177625876 /NCGR_PEP_ID=MMETSP0419_2-20121207/30344_1 /TAXON_ID=582737 /ORGANISM="Tetraselmis sp., Strain GSL018" /LENGTH=529 /DNA_ID=CAMNT_0019126873 /DNA_START=53 /DNA_END=1640 /DNA_ORIENTATION=-
MSVAEGLKGARAELEQLPALQKIRKAVQLSVIISQELFGSLLQIPYGFRAFRTYHSLPKAALPGASKEDAVTLIRDLRYASGERCVIDLYLPPGKDLSKTFDDDTGTPAALFCHGGVWSTGSKWHYAPMAKRMAQEGVLVGVMQYSLYPQAMVPRMVDEVGAALTWMMDNAQRYGASSDRVSLLGHSAGAHLCAMALLQRAPIAAGSKEGRAGGGEDARMPQQFIGMAGVYDVSQHYLYEEARGVAKLSTMERAMGGSAGFAALSPSQLLAEAAWRHRQHAERRQLEGLRGERLSQRIGLDHDLDGPLPPVTAPGESPAAPVLSQKDMAACGMKDTVVPWYESAEFALRLRDAGVPVKKLTYKAADHGTFVTGWRAKNGPARPEDGLPDPCEDTLEIIKRGHSSVAFPRSLSVGTLDSAGKGSASLLEEFGAGADSPEQIKACTDPPEEPSAGAPADRTGRAAGDWRAAAGRVSAAPDLACARVLAAVEPAPPVGDGVAVERGAADALVDRVVEAAHPVLELGPAPGNW